MLPEYSGFQPIPRNQSVRIIDAPADLRREGIADAGGVCTIEVATIPPDNQVWLIERVVCASESVAATQFALYNGEPDLANRVEWTDGGNGNVADELQPIRYQPSDRIVARWVGATPGARCTVRLQFSRAVIEG